MGKRATCGRASRIGRFLVFNCVGALGIVVQLAGLWLLVRLAGLGYLAATVLATELAVLHNFAWHRLWTWRDRRASLAGWVLRLWRFHLANGAVSVVGNALLMAALVGWLKVPYLPANLVAIVVCSGANFLAADDYVFRQERPDAGSLRRPIEA
jgi:dolichol-phosphate mannosyltransferase